MSSFSDLPALGPTSRITKSRSRTAVKPILKKAPHSEKNSLDLDRGWEDAIHYGNHGWGGGKKSSDSFARGGSAAAAPGLGLTEGGRGKDVSFSLSGADLNGGGVGTASSYAPRKYSHARSASGTSHVSVATSASGPRGTFVHPFQQTPRASTPPLSYANSLASLDAPAHARDYSPTITEGGDDLDVALRGYHTAPQQLRRPSLASQRTSSATELGGLRVNTSRANTARLQPSRSELRVSDDSPQSTTAPAQTLASPGSGSAAPSLSPLRSSLEMNFRLRSRSELDTAARQAQIREARRQFEDKEAVKQAMRDEKAARRRDAEGRRKARREEGEGRGEAGDVGVVGGEEVEVEEGVKRVSARRRTAGVWTSFILWVRTKLLKAGRR